MAHGNNGFKGTVQCRLFDEYSQPWVLPFKKKRMGLVPKKTRLGVGVYLICCSCQIFMSVLPRPDFVPVPAPTILTKSLEIFTADTGRGQGVEDLRSSPIFENTLRTVILRINEQHHPDPGQKVLRRVSSQRDCFFPASLSLDPFQDWSSLRGGSH